MRIEEDMAYATIMVNYGFEGGPDARLRLAKSLADRFHATLIGVVACRSDDSARHGNARRIGSALAAKSAHQKE